MLGLFSSQATDFSTASRVFTRRKARTMCGIYGVLDLDGRGPRRHNSEAMGNVLHHRGPDDGGTLRCGPITMGFRRLSIIDVTGGHQPMANEDGTIWIEGH